VARPQKQTVDYFPHDTDASTNSRTLKILENRFGNDGYTFWFKLLELLGRKEGHYIDFNDEDGLEYLSSETKIKDIETLKEMLEILVRRGSIDKELFEHKIIWCQSFVEGIADAYRNRKASLPQKPNLNNIRNSIPDSHNSISDSDNPQTKVKESKVNNNIYILHEFPNIKLSKEEYDKLIGLFGEAGTRDRIKSLSLYMGSTGKAYKSHYLTILNWEERDRKGKNVSTSPAPKGKYDNAVCHNQDDIDQAMKHIRGANREK